MASPTFYDVSITPFVNGLAALTHILKKAEAAPNSASFPEAKLTEDMLPLTFQVFFMTNTAQQVFSRTSGIEPLSLDRNLKTFDDFYARIKQVTDLIATADKEKINASPAKTATIGMGPGKNVDMVISSYVAGYALPNMYFHLMTAYSILRKEGVELGKMDYLNHFLGEYAVKN